MFNQSGEALTEKDIPEYEANKSIEEIFKDLNELVGLQNVKDMLSDLVSLCEFKKMAGSAIKKVGNEAFQQAKSVGNTLKQLRAETLYNLGMIDEKGR